MSIEVDGEHYRHRDQCHHESCYDQAVARLFELFKGIPPISSNVDFTRYPSQAEIKSITSEGEDLIGDELGDCFVIKEVNIKTSNKTVFVHIQMTEPW